MDVFAIDFRLARFKQLLNNHRFYPLLFAFGVFKLVCFLKAIFVDTQNMKSSYDALNSVFLFRIAGFYTNKQMHHHIFDKKNKNYKNPSG